MNIFGCALQYCYINILIPQTLIHFPGKIMRRRSFFRSVTGFNENKNSR